MKTAYDFQSFVSFKTQQGGGGWFRNTKREY